MTLALPARAKLNIDLEVLGRDRAGWHELRSTFQAIDLHDTLDVRLADQTSLTTSGLAFDATKDNTIVKAHRALEAATGRALPARIHLHKRIPPGSGLGGASSDAAATLRGLSALYGLDDVDLNAIAEQVGADVPFFLHGGRALAEGRGERLTELAVEEAWFAVAWPGIELSTPDVYRAWDEVGGEAPNHLRRAAELVAPQLKEFAEQLERVSRGWQMTGSGSAFFKRTPSEHEGRKQIEKLECWTAVARAAYRW